MHSHEFEMDKDIKGFLKVDGGIEGGDHINIIIDLESLKDSVDDEGNVTIQLTQKDISVMAEELPLDEGDGYLLEEIGIDEQSLVQWIVTQINIYGKKPMEVLNDLAHDHQLTLNPQA